MELFNLSEENELDTYMSREITVLRLKALHQKNLGKAKKIIVDSITNQLVPQVSSLKTPKEMFDSLTKIFEGKNINRKMTLRNQLNNVKIQNAETIQSYFTRVSQIKERLELMDEEAENVEFVMTTLNDLPRSWDSFIQGICSRRNLVTFSRSWEEFSQEEDQIVSRE